MSHAIGVLAAVMVLGLVAWSALPRRRPPRRERDEVDRVCERVEAVVRSGADYVDSRVAVLLEMPGVWSVTLDGKMLARTARSPEQARRVVEDHLRRTRRHGGHAVGHARPSRRSRTYDWRRDVTP